jgi:hypothetical protein
MTHRFMPLESGALDAHHKTDKINARRATLIRTSITFGILPSVDYAKPPAGLGNARAKPLTLSPLSPLPSPLGRGKRGRGIG